MCIFSKSEPGMTVASQSTFMTNWLFANAHAMSGGEVVLQIIWGRIAFSRRRISTNSTILHTLNTQTTPITLWAFTSIPKFVVPHLFDNVSKSFRMWTRNGSVAFILPTLPISSKECLLLQVLIKNTILKNCKCNKYLVPCRLETSGSGADELLFRQQELHGWSITRDETR